ncbi:DUF6221 family protein [Streptomyces cyaneofuscatus]|uniref:DUF6221 family protein n=1 Tax=Streptomyces cyaneofuscatus TaxID=66883 RepID=UPI0036E6C617
MNQPTTPTRGERIVAYLDAAITAREEAAHSAPRGPWSVRLDDDAVVAPDGITVAEVFALGGQQTRAILDLIALHDSTEVLRHCAADRKLIELHTPAEWPSQASAVCLTCSDWNHNVAMGDDSASAVPFPCPTIIALAEGYGWTEDAR